MIKTKLCMGFQLALCISLCGCNATAAVAAQPIPASTDPVRQTNTDTIKPLPPSASNHSPNDKNENQIVVDRNKSIFFPARLATMGDDRKDKLQTRAERLKLNSNLEVMPIGQSDDQGSKSHDLAIADQRIGAVRSMLNSLVLNLVRNMGTGATG